MREHKYRVWDIAKKVMYEWEVVCACNWDFSDMNNPKQIFLQFIGIHDDKRTEVYEGDVVKFDNSDIGGGVYIGEVIFNTDQTLGNLEWGLWNSRGYFHTDFLGKLEILGNVYENPSLVETAK